MKALEFTRGMDIAKMADGRMSTRFSINIEKKETSYFIHIPSLNIYFYTKTEEEIEQSMHESVVSFFKFWINKKTRSQFIEHMIDLGFSINSGAVPKNAVQKGTTKIASDEFVLS